ncbi:MAG TPA: RdgB/HAM1 family non-canonical purine NTP pyrophosphatase [Rubricoccaceae bacterium]|jgi:XTP/dITP diphosphohydrolase
MTPDPTTLILATRNAGKVAELADRLGGRFHLVSAADVPGAPDVPETAETLVGNAMLKAVALFAHTGGPALADDTGLLVHALGGAPGVHSARFAGPDADDAANRARLLLDLDGVADRSAHFETVLAFATDAGIRLFRGTCTGTIQSAERGVGGFGYDALFVPDDGDGRTFAEMTTAEKGRISHRARALDAFAAAMASAA